MVSPEEVERLAELYARSAHNLDPFSQDARRANAEFLQQVDQLYTREGLQSVSKSEFKAELIRRCKAFLRREERRPGM